MATKKMFIPLENNPETLTALAHTLGLASKFTFHDVLSLTDPALTSFLPRPCIALIAIIPLTPTWQADRTKEDSTRAPYDESGLAEPVLWFKQTIGHACGLISLLHACLNGAAAECIVQDSILARIKEQAVRLKREERAKLLYDDLELEKAHMAAAVKGDTVAPDALSFKNGLHFVTFVKGKDGHLWELEGNRKGPMDRGILGGDEDVLSLRAVQMGLGRIMKMEEEAGGIELRFSCIALAEVE